MPTTEITVSHEVGLHARPASMFVKLASSFPCDVSIRNVTTDSKTANAKSILGVLSLGVNQDNVLEITTSGDQEDEALAALLELVEDNFGE